MSKKITTLDFTGQKFYIGMDTHLRNWKVAIRTDQMHLKRFSMNPSSSELWKYMNRNYPGAEYFSVYEAGFCGYWIHRELSDLGFKNIIVNPADVPSTHKEKERKSDGIDCSKLSRELENGSLRCIYVPSKERESIRNVSRLYRQYSKRSTQVKNRIKGLLYFSGNNLDPECNSHWSNMFMAMLKQLTIDEPNTKMVLDVHIRELEHIRTVQLSLLRCIRGMSKENRIIKLLRSVPGVGVVIAFVLYAELIDIKRFKNLDHLCSYVGLVPSVKSSDEHEVVKGLTHRHSRYVRYLLVEAAWRAVKVDPALTLGFKNLTKRMSKQKAIIHIAKKLLNRIRCVWINEQEYVAAVIE